MRAALSLVLIVLLLAGCGSSSIQDDFGAWETLPTNDASGSGVALLLNSGVAKRSTDRTVKPDRFRQPSSDDVTIISVEGNKARIGVGGHEFYLLVDQPFLTETETSYVQMVKRTDGGYDVMRLSHAKAINDTVEI